MDLLTTRNFGGALLTAALSTGLVAQGQFLDLPSGAGSAWAVSDDGNVVAGTGSSGVYRWTAAGGIQYLNLMLSSRADVSADGTVIMATMPGSQSPSGFSEGAYWTQAAGWTAIGGLIGSNCSGSLSSAYAISKDGKTIVGLGWESCKGRAFRWDAQNGMNDLGLLSTHFTASARANAVAGDGSVIGGWDTAASGLRRAAVWFPVGTSYTEMLIIPPSPANPDGGGEVWGMNQTGSVIVGHEYGGEAWRWKNGVFESLGAYPGSQPGSSGAAYATNADGSMIVGSDGGGGAVFMWTEQDGMQRMTDFLADQEIVIPSGRPLTWAFDISPSGYHIVGRRGDVRSGGQNAYWIELPAGVRYGVGKGGANTMRLAGTGSTALGGTLTVTTDQLPSAKALTTTLIGLRSANLRLLGGTLLVDLSLPHVAVGIPAAAGSASFNLTIPNLPAAVGASIYLQSVVVGQGAAGGIAFSTGLRSTIQ